MPSKKMPIDRSDYILTRELPDGRVIDVAPLLGGRARIMLSENAETFAWLDGW